MAKTADKKTTAIAKTSAGNQSVVQKLDLSAEQFATIAMKSGYFKDAKGLADFYLKMSIGAALGIDPASAMSSIIVVSGRLSFTSNLIAARIMQSQKYRFDVLEKSATVCRLQFYQRIEDYTESGALIKRWIKCPIEEKFTLEMAKRAGLIQKNATVWNAYPEALLFARALTSGSRTFCPDVMYGVPAYTPDELGCPVVVDSEGNVSADPEVVKDQTQIPSELIPDAEFTEPAESSKQFVLLEQLLKDTDTDTVKFLSVYGKDTLAQLTPEDVADGIKKLQLKVRAK